MARRRDRARGAYHSYRSQAAQRSGANTLRGRVAQAARPGADVHADRDPADDRDHLPVLPLEPAVGERAADLLVPLGALGGDDPRLHDDGRRPERRRRLLRPARPRLRRLLRDRRLHRRLARLGPVPAGELPLRLGRHQPRRARDPHLDLAGAAHRGAADRLRGSPDRVTDAAPARGLPRDRDARLRRDHPAVRAQRRQPARLRPDARHVRDQPDRLARLRQPLARRGRPAQRLLAGVHRRPALLLDRAG